jgi:hypothetical protein
VALVIEKHKGGTGHLKKAWRNRKTTKKSRKQSPWDGSGREPKTTTI